MHYSAVGWNVLFPPKGFRFLISANFLVGCYNFFSISHFWSGFNSDKFQKCFMAFPVEFLDFIAKVEVFCALRGPSAGIQQSELMQTYSE